MFLTALDQEEAVLLQLQLALELYPVLALVRLLPLAAEEPLMEDQVAAAAAVVEHAVVQHAVAAGFLKTKKARLIKNLTLFSKAMHQAAIEKYTLNTQRQSEITSNSQ